MAHQSYPYPYYRYLMAWAVHVFTASAAFIGVLSLMMIYQHRYIDAFWLMALTVFIDAVDGTMARKVGVKEVLPKIDGTLLDNIVDYLNYVITPCFFLYIKPGMLPEGLAHVIVFAITLTSAYQFSQADAKTPDHFFKGFPCFWNFAVFYMFIFNTQPMTNVLLLAFFCVLIFVPVKYVYPSRLDYLTESKKLKILMHCCSVTYGLSSMLVILSYPDPQPFWLALSLSYVVMYIVISFYRTYSPLIKAKINEQRQSMNQSK